MSDAIKIEKSITEIELPDHGEDGVVLVLKLPTGERFNVMYKSFYGEVDVWTEGADGNPIVVSAINWTDRFDKNGKAVQSMLPAPRDDHPHSGGDHVRMVTQICMCVGPTRAE